MLISNIEHLLELFNFFFFPRSGTIPCKMIIFPTLITLCSIPIFSCSGSWPGPTVACTSSSILACSCFCHNCHFYICFYTSTILSTIAPYVSSKDTSAIILFLFWPTSVLSVVSSVTTVWSIIWPMPVLIAPLIVISVLTSTSTLMDLWFELSTCSAISGN